MKNKTSLCFHEVLLVLIYRIIFHLPPKVVNYPQNSHGKCALLEVRSNHPLLVRFSQSHHISICSFNFVEYNFHFAFSYFSFDAIHCSYYPFFLIMEYLHFLW